MPKPSTPAVWASGKSFGFTPSPAQQAQGFDYIATVRPATGAPITDDHDWPLNQITSALKWTLDSGFGYGSAMIGVPIPWPLQQMPQDIWPECGMKFLAMTGQSFSATTYPLLAQAYQSLVLPDLRAQFIRGLDNGRGVDVGRAILTLQGDAIREVSGSLRTVSDASLFEGPGQGATGAFVPSELRQFATLSTSSGSTNEYPRTITFSAAASGVPVAADNRPTNVAFNYIVRAA